MRSIVLSEFMTLDGVIEAPDKWSFPYWNDEIAKFKHAELFASDALLLGRVTYQGFAAAWPSRTDEEGYADRINNLPKYVASKTLTSLEWNNAHLLKGSLASEIQRIQEQPGQNILIFGSGTFARFLMQNNLIDQYNLLVYPLTRGSGKRLFPDGFDANLKLVETRPFDSGVVLLIYQPDKKKMQPPGA